MFNYSSKDNEGRSSSHLERVERVHGRELSPKIKLGIARGIVGVGFAGLIASVIWSTVKVMKEPHGGYPQPTSTGGGDGVNAVPPSDGDSGDSAHGGESGGHAGGGGSKLHPKSRLDTIADGIVTI